MLDKSQEELPNIYTEEIFSGVLSQVREAVDKENEEEEGYASRVTVRALNLDAYDQYEQISERTVRES